MDVKLVMELNKLYHLVVLACAYDYTKEEKYIYKIEEDINSWRKEVRYESGVINKIIMDLAYRNLNLIYVCILCQKSDYFQEKIYPYIVNILYWQICRLKNLLLLNGLRLEMHLIILSEKWSVILLLPYGYPVS